MEDFDKWWNELDEDFKAFVFKLIDWHKNCPSNPHMGPSLGESPDVGGGQLPPHHGG